VTVAILGFVLSSLPPHLRWNISEHWYDPKLNLVTIRLSDDFEGGDDSEAHRAAQLFHAICIQGYTLKVLPYRVGGWVPSRRNPMTVEWTKYLIAD
jgi:hypothetical protein